MLRIRPYIFIFAQGMISIPICPLAAACLDAIKPLTFLVESK